MTQDLGGYIHMLSSLKYKGKNIKIFPLARILLPENISIGDESIIEDLAFLYASGKGIEIGNFCHITTHCTLYAGGLITFKDFSAIAPGTVVLGETDDYRGMGFVGNSVFGDKYRNKTEAPVTFERHAHVGSNCVIMPGVTIGEGCSIGAGSVVTKDMPAWTICYGSPCKPIRGKPRARQLQMEKDFLEEYYGDKNATL